MFLKYSKIVIAHGLLGIVFAFFYTQMAVPSFKEVSIKIRDVRGKTSFELPEAGPYMIKIWGDDPVDRIVLNGNDLIHMIYRPRQVIKEFYYVVGPSMTRQGENVLEIFPDKRCSLRIKNNIVSSGFGSILFKDTDTAPTTLGVYAYPVFAAGFIFFGLAFVSWTEKFFALPFRDFFLKHLLSFLPCLLVLAALTKISAVFPIKFVFFEDSYVAFCCFLVVIVYVPFFISAIAREMKKIKAGIDDLELKRRFMGLTFIQWWLNKRRVEQLTLIFLACLFIGSALLTFKLEFLAKIIGDIAYVLICAVVIIHLIEFRKTGEGSRDR